MIGEYELDRLRNEGIQVITPDYVITHNPFTDEFSLDVPENRKEITIKTDINDNLYQWNASIIYHVKVKFKDYNQVKCELEPYIMGATLSLLPSYTEEGREYVWFDDSEQGEITVCKDVMTIIE